MWSCKRDKQRQKQEATEARCPGHDYRFLDSRKAQWDWVFERHYDFVPLPWEQAEWTPGWSNYKCILCGHILRLEYGESLIKEAKDG